MSYSTVDYESRNHSPKTGNSDAGNCAVAGEMSADEDLLSLAQDL
jgi:hypothetical protein